MQAAQESCKKSTDSWSTISFGAKDEVRKSTKLRMEAASCSSSTIKADVLAEEGKPSAPVHHVTPDTRTHSAHHAIAFTNGIDVDGYIAPNSCKNNPTLLAYLSGDEPWAINHTLAHHADEIQRSHYWVKIYTLDPLKNAAFNLSLLK